MITETPVSSRIINLKSTLNGLSLIEEWESREDLDGHLQSDTFTLLMGTRYLLLTRVTFNDRTQLDLKIYFFEARKFIAKSDGDVPDVGRKRYPSAQKKLDVKTISNLATVKKSCDFFGSIIIVLSSPALYRVIAHGDEIFPQTPVVFIAILREQLKRLDIKAHVTGVLADIDFAGLLDTALQIHPQTRRVTL